MDNCLSTATFYIDSRINYDAYIGSILPQGVMDENGHHYSVSSGSYIPETCTENGQITFCCTHCGAVLVEQEEIPAKGHTEVTDPAEDPICTENGTTEGSHCSDCGEVIVEQEILDPIGHSYEAPEFEWDEGYNCVAVFTCVNCGESQDVACDVTAETWEEDGVTIYTATVTFEETVYSDSMSVENPEEDDHEHVAEDCWHCDNDFHWLQCAECGEIMEIEEHIPGTEATEDTSRYCEICDRIVRAPPGSGLDHRPNPGSRQQYVCFRLLYADCGTVWRIYLQYGPVKDNAFACMPEISHRDPVNPLNGKHPHSFGCGCFAAGDETECGSFFAGGTGRESAFHADRKE